MTVPQPNRQAEKPLERLVIIGNGMAADRLLECLSELSAPFSILVIGEESEPAYNRIMLSSVLAAEKTAEQIQLKAPQWYEQNSIEILSGDPVISIDTHNLVVITESGKNIGYQKLVFATGARASLPDLPGNTHPSVSCFRNMKDVASLIEQSKSIKRVAIVGGGLLGLEAAHGMNLAGVKVDLVHRRSYLMNRQLDQRAGQILQEQLQRRGIDFHMSREPKTILPASNSKADSTARLILDNDKCIAADLIIFAAGITPNKELAEISGIECNRAICVDDYMQTSAEDIYAIGECAEHSGRTIGLVAPAKAQAQVLADNLLGNQTPYQYQETSTHLKVSGIEMFSAGRVESNTEAEKDSKNTESLQIEDAAFGVYRRLQITNNQLTSAVLLGDKRSGSWYEKLIEDQQDVSELVPEIIFGRDYCLEQIETSKINSVEVI